MRPNESSESSIVSRREAIRRAALLAGVAVSSDWLNLAGQAQTGMSSHYLTQPFVFTKSRFDQLRMRIQIKEVFDPGEQ